MQLIWFRQDLRIHDHTALWHAQQAGTCLGIVILSADQWQKHDDAIVKIDFYLRQLHVLKQQLAERNIPLIVLNIPLWQNVSEQLLQVCNTLNIKALHANIELGFNELQRDLACQKRLEQHKIQVELYHDRTLLPVGTIRNKTNQPYQVYSAFKRNCYEKLSVSLPQCYPTIETQEPIEDLPSQLNQDIPTLSELCCEWTVDASLQEQWQVTEQYAWQILQEFIQDKVKHYKHERDFPNLNSTSKIAAYLNIGLISIRQCVNALFSKYQGHLQFDHDGEQVWFDELLWREFYQHILFDFPHVSKNLPFKRNTIKIEWRDAPKDLEAWQQGQTGIPIVDAGMRQLLATGWMHNRVRMICAMFLTKNLLIDWRLGEAWFMQHLIDGDLAANNGGWQWCASTGTDAAPYFRVFNPISQSEKFDENGDYIRTWVPELAHLNSKFIHEPFAKNPRLALNYPKPLVDLKSSRVRAIEAFKNLD